MRESTVKFRYWLRPAFCVYVLFVRLIVVTIYVNAKWKKQNT